MRLSPLQQYGRRGLTPRARRANATPTTIRSISESEGLSTAYVGKLMFLMQKGGLVQATRGVQGGYVLVKSPDEVTLDQVFAALDPGGLEDVCEKFTGLEAQCVHNGNCSVKRMWDGLSGHLQSYLRGITLRDLSGQVGQPLTPPRPVAV